MNAQTLLDKVGNRAPVSLDDGIAGEIIDDVEAALKQSVAASLNTAPLP
jgi:hypothetical protein